MFLHVCLCVCASTSSGEIPQQKLHQNTRSREPPAPAVRVLGLVGGLVQVPTAGPHQVTALTDIGMQTCCFTRYEFISLWMFFKWEPQTLSSCAPLLYQEVLRREDRSVLRLARLVHGDAVSCSAGRPLCVPVRPLHAGALPGQVNTPRLFYERK